MAKTTAVMNVVPDVVTRKIYLSVKEELLHPDDNNTGMGHLAQQFRKHCHLMPHHIKNPLSHVIIFYPMNTTDTYPR